MESGAGCPAGTNTFEIEYGNSIEEFLDSIYLAGADIGGTRLETMPKALNAATKC